MTLPLFSDPALNTLVHFIPIESIVIPPARQRKFFDERAHTDLIDSILRPAGLLHPLTLLPDRRTLITGERRLRAVRQIFLSGKQFTYCSELVPLGFVPCAVLGELPPIEYFETEITENIARLDFTWQEKEMAIAELIRLRRTQNPEVTLRSIAEELSPDPSDRQIDNVSTAEVLANNLHRPSVAGAKNRTQALQTLRRELRRDFAAELLTATAAPKEMHFKVSDFRDYMNELEPSSIDCILTDPPYGKDAQNFSLENEWSSTIKKHAYDDSFSTWINIMFDLPTLCHKALKPNGTIFCFFDMEYYSTLRQRFNNVSEDMEVWPYPIIWNKGVLGPVPDQTRYPRRCYEAIMIVRKGDPKVTDIFPDVVSFRPVVGAEREYAPQKPVDLYVDLLKRVCLPSAKVLDPFCGTGTIFAAASQLKLEAFGCDSNPEVQDIVASTLRSLDL
jgi:DNA modification methylase